MTYDRKVIMTGAWRRYYGRTRADMPFDRERFSFYLAAQWYIAVHGLPAAQHAQNAISDHIMGRNVTTPYYR